MPAGLSFGEGSVPGVQKATYLLCPHMAERERSVREKRTHGSSGVFSIKNLRLSDWRSALMISVSLNTLTLTLAFPKGNQS